MNSERIAQVAHYLVDSVGATNAERDAVIAQRWPGLTSEERQCACDVAVAHTREEAGNLAFIADALEAELARRERIRMLDG
jgi:hypothetical protein